MKNNIFLITVLALSSDVFAMDQITTGLQQLQQQLTTLQTTINHLYKGPTQKTEAQKLEELLAPYLNNLKKLEELPSDQLNNLGSAAIRYEILAQSKKYEPIVKKILDDFDQQSSKKVYALPAESELKKLQLCPTASLEKYREYAELPAMNAQQIITQPIPCRIEAIKPIKSSGLEPILLFQLNVVDQFKLAKELGIIDPAICSVVSLYDAKTIVEYAYMGKVEILENLLNENEAKKFITSFHLQQWPTAEQFQRYIETTNQENYTGVIENALTLNNKTRNDLKETFFDEKSTYNAAYVEKIKNKVHEGLKQDNFVYCIVFGTGDTAKDGRGHYFALAIIKSKNKIQFVVLDSAPAAYHLHPKSYEFLRLQFIIEELVIGQSSLTPIDYTQFSNLVAGID